MKRSQENGKSLTEGNAHLLLRFLHPLSSILQSILSHQDLRVNYQFQHFSKKTNQLSFLLCNLVIQVISLSAWVSFINFTNSLQLSTLQFVLVLVGEHTGLGKIFIPRKRTMRNEQFYSPSWAFSFLLEVSDLAHSIRLGVKCYLKLPCDWATVPAVRPSI